MIYYNIGKHVAFLQYEFFGVYLEFHEQQTFYCTENKIILIKWMLFKKINIQHYLTDS